MPPRETPPAPPAALRPYIRDGAFDPGDYDWMRGAFADASDAQRAGFAAIRTWTDQCLTHATAAMRRELASMGIASPTLHELSTGPSLCLAVRAATIRHPEEDFEAFRRDLAVARPIAETYLAATRVAEKVGAAQRGMLADRLLARPLGEQMLRYAANWGQGSMNEVPPLAPGPLALMRRRIAVATVEHDAANTAWLAKIVEEQGWPALSDVGEEAAGQAWLLVQHADADPAFQLRVLRLMEPMLARGEASKRNYAYLYDRVMLKLTGRQRYATQMTCERGQRVPLPLEDPTSVDRARATMDLGPLADYAAQMQRFYGDCPPDRPAPNGANRGETNRAGAR